MATTSEDSTTIRSTSTSPKQPAGEDDKRLSYSSTEKIESLIKKYKSRSKELVRERRYTDSTSGAAVDELEAWSSVSKELRHHGLEPVSLNTSDGCLVLDETSSSSLRHTILSLLEELQRKDAVLSELTTATASTPPPPSSIVGDGESVAVKLREEIAHLQYTNARLKVELMNRPLSKELERCQRRLKEMEQAQQKYRNALSSEQLDLINAENELKNVRAAVGIVGKKDSVSAITAIRERSDKLATVEQYLVNVANAVLDNTSSHPPPAMGSSSSSLLCPQLWSAVSNTLNQWRDDLTGLQELSIAVGELCHTPTAAGHTHTAASPNLSCRMMARLVRSWMSTRGNRKLARSSVLADVVTHFQRLFDVPTLDGVYPRLSMLYQQLQEGKTALHNLHSLLGVDSHTSWQNVVSCVEVLTAQEHNQLVLSIQQQFGALTNEQVLQQLSLCQQFFPTFKHLVSEIQEFLGVQSLSAIMPALKQLSLS